MTAILLNHGEIAARDPGKCFAVFQRRGIAFKTRVGMGKNIFFADQRTGFCPHGSMPNPYNQELLRDCKIFLTNA
jgi:hypothetical protein